MMRAEIKIRQSGATSRSYNISHDELRKADFDYFKHMERASAKLRNRVLIASGRPDLVPRRPRRPRKPAIPKVVRAPVAPLPVLRAPCRIEKPQTWREIVAAVAWDFDVDPAGMISKSRKRPLVDARHTAMFILFKRDRGLAQIGRCFSGRDHSTVIHAVARFAPDALPVTVRASAKMFDVASRYVETECSE